MRPCVPFKVECIVEALAAEGAEIALGVAVALHVAVQQALEIEDLGAYSTLELGRIGLGAHGRKLFLGRLHRRVRRHWIFETMAAIDELDRHVRGDAKL